MRGGGDVAYIAPDDPALTDGWYAVERDAASLWRWSDGDATIALPFSVRASVLEVEIGISLAYPVADAVAGARAA